MWGPHLGTDGNYGGMGGMMGGGSYETVSYLWIIPTVLIGVVVVAMIGVGFYHGVSHEHTTRSRH